MRNQEDVLSESTDTEGATTSTEDSGWGKRERRLLEHVDGNMRWMMDTAERNKENHTRLSFASLILAVLAPLFAVTSTTPAAALDLTHGWLPIISAVLTVLLAVAEGVRRIGRYDEIWRTMDVVMLELRSTREVFRDARVEHQLGSPQRIAAYKTFRKDAERGIGLAVLAAHRTPNGPANANV